MMTSQEIENILSQINALLDAKERDESHIKTMLSITLNELEPGELRYKALDLQIRLESDKHNKQEYEVLPKYMQELKKSAKVIEWAHYKIDYLCKYKLIDLSKHIQDFLNSDRFYPFTPETQQVHFKIVKDIYQMGKITNYAKRNKGELAIGVNAVPISILLTPYLDFLGHVREMRKVILIREKVMEMLLFTLGMGVSLQKRGESDAVSVLIDESFLFDLYTFALIVDIKEFRQYYNNRMKYMKQLFGENIELFRKSRQFIDAQIENSKSINSLGVMKKRFKIEEFYNEKVDLEKICRGTEALQKMFSLIIDVRKKMTVEGRDKEIIEYSMAYIILHFFLGNNWCDRNIENAQPDGFFYSPSVEEQRSEAKKAIEAGAIYIDIHGIRIISLADYIWRLMTVEGIWEFVDKLKDKADAQATFLEIESCHVFFKAGYEVRFNKETGQKGLDYDLEFENEKFDTLYVEVKSREQTTKDATYIKNALKKAKEQIPKNGNGVIILRLACELLAKNIDEIEKEVKLFLKNTGRVKFVIFRFLTWHLKDNQLQMATRSRIFKNPKFNEFPDLKLKKGEYWSEQDFKVPSFISDTNEIVRKEIVKDHWS